MFKRKSVVKKSEELYRNECVEALTKRSRLYGAKDKNQKRDFTLWVKQVYEDLIKHEMAETIMKIVSYSLKVAIIFNPEKKYLCIANRMDGATYGRLEQIFIAVGNYKDEQRRDEFKGLIIHEFCHFAAYETFCNDYKGFYPDDEDYKQKWNEAVDECKAKKDQEELIKIAFGYKEKYWLMELVVRYLQYQVQFLNDNSKLDQFKEKYPKLCEICEKYVLVNFNEENEKIRAVREINRKVVGCDDSHYNVMALKSDSVEVLLKTQIVKSNNTALIANHIYHKFSKEENFETRFIFCYAQHLNDNSGLFEKFKIAAKRMVKSTFILDCERNINLSQINPDLHSLINDMAKTHNMILLSEIENFKNLEMIKFESEFTITPEILTHEFIGKIKISFQGRDDLSLTNIVTIEEVQSLKIIPPGKIHEGRILIGSQIEPEICTHYVQRTFSIKNENEWDDFDDFDNIFESHSRVLISNGPGAGKSVESNTMYHRFKKNQFNQKSNDNLINWIVHINLSDFYEVLENINSIIQSDMENIFLEKILKLNQFEKELFNLIVKAGRVIFIIDSLDEIAPKYVDIVRNLIEMLFSLNKEQRIIVFSRPHIASRFDDFEFTLFKMDDVVEENKRELIRKILKSKYPDQSPEKKLKRIELFLERKNLHTPLMIKMVTEVSSYPSFDAEETTIFGIYETFIVEFIEATDFKNSDYVKDYKLRVLPDVNRYFEKHALDNLIKSQDYLRKNGMEKIHLENFMTYYFGKIKIPTTDDLQRMGIIHFDSSQSHKFIHSSFQDFYIAKFIKEQVKTFAGEKDLKNVLVEMFLMLLNEDRYRSVVDFLKCFDSEVAASFQEFKVVTQNLTQKSTENANDDVNIIPVINFLVEIISNHSSLNRICVENNIYPSTIQFTDPIESLNKIYTLKKYLWKSEKQWKLHVKEIVLMNKNDYQFQHPGNRGNNSMLQRHFSNNDSEESKEFESPYDIKKFPINVFDILADCGRSNTEAIEYFVTKDQFKEYFASLTYECFCEEQIATMLSPLIETVPDYTRSFFLMANNRNKTVVETFLDFYERKLIVFETFRNPSFFSFAPILTLNNNFEKFEKLIFLIQKLSAINKTPLGIFFDPTFKESNHHNWLLTLSENIEKNHEVLSDELLSYALEFFISIIDSEKNLLSLCLKKCKYLYGNQLCESGNFLFSLTDVKLQKQLKIILNKLKQCLSKKSLQVILTERNSSKLTVFQSIFAQINTDASDIEYIIKFYEKVFDEQTMNVVRDFILNVDFFHELLKQIILINAESENNKQFIIDKVMKKILNILEILKDFELQKQFLLSQDKNGQTILTAVMKLKNESLLTELVSWCSNFLGCKMIDLLVLNERKSDSFLSKIELKDSSCDIEELILRAFEVNFNSKCTEAIFDIFSNAILSEEIFFCFLKKVYNKLKLNRATIDKLFSYTCTEDDDSSVLIAAAKCKRRGRVRIFLDLFEDYLDSDSFKHCLFKTDKHNTNAVLHLLMNEHQDYDFPLLFKHIEIFYSYDDDDLRRVALDFMSTSRRSDELNLLSDILVFNKSGIKCDIISILMNYLKKEDKEKLIYEYGMRKTFNIRMSETLFFEYIKMSFEIPASTVKDIVKNIFENQKLHLKIFSKLKTSRDIGLKTLVNTSEFESALNLYNQLGLKQTHTYVVSFLEFIEKRQCYLIHVELLNRNFSLFREENFIDSMIDSINLCFSDRSMEIGRIYDKSLKDKLKILLLTFIYIVSSGAFRPFLDTISSDHNDEACSIEGIFRLVQSSLTAAQMKDLMMYRNVIYENYPYYAKGFNKYSPLQLCLKGGSLRFQEEFLECLKDVFENCENYKAYLISEITSLYCEHNIFHIILKQRRVDCKIFSATYEILLSQFKEQKELIKELFFQQNCFGETPFMYALQKPNVKELLMFFRKNFDKNEMKNLMKISDMYDRNAIARMLISFGISECYFDEALGLVHEFFDESERYNFLVDITTKKDKNGENLIHTFFYPDRSNGCKSVLKLENVLKNREHLKFLMKQKNNEDKYPIQSASHSRTESFIENLKLIETFFHDEKETIQVFLTHKDNNGWFILYMSLLSGCYESKKFTIEFYQKYFAPSELTELVIDSLKIADRDGTTLLHEILTPDKFNEAKFYLICDVIKKHIRNIEIVKSIFTQRNDDGETPLMIAAKYLTISLVDLITVLGNEYLTQGIIKEILTIADNEKTSIINTLLKRNCKNETEKQKIQKLYETFFHDHWDYDLD